MSGFSALRATSAWGVAVLAAATVVLAPQASAAPLPSWPIGTPNLSVNVNSPAGFDGDIFYSTGLPAAVPFLPAQALSGLPGIAASNVIMTKAGQTVWKYTPPPGEGVSDFRVQTYRGKRVLTWWQGQAQGGHGEGVDYIADENYHVIKTITPGNGLSSDAHEFRLTPDGRALITSYKQVSADLTAVGGPRDGQMYDCFASVIDVDSGRVISSWDVMKHVPLTESQALGQMPGTGVYDPFHINSIALAPDGNLLISMRNTSTIYNVDPASGEIRWRLGGRNSSLRLLGGAEFAFQHDAEYTDANTIRLFNDNSSGPDTRGLSSIEWMRVDAKAGTATLVRNQTHPAGLVSAAMGNAQGLSNGDTFGGWGLAPHISEFSPTGELVYGLTLPVGTYRAYLAPWK